MSTARTRHALSQDIIERLVRRHSIATVLFHEAIAERLQLSPADHKCLDLLHERGPLTGSNLATITDLTSGAITGVVARLERAGYLRREPDPDDRRQQILHATRERLGDLHQVFDPVRADVAAVLAQFDAHQLSAVAEFLRRSTEIAYRHVALLRAQGAATASADGGHGSRPARSPRVQRKRHRRREGHRKEHES